MAYYLQFDGSGYVHSPTLGNVSSSVIRVEQTEAYIDLINGDGFIFSQCTATGSSREIGLFINGATNTIGLSKGGQTNAAIADASSLGTSLIEGFFAFEIDMTTGAWLIEDDTGVIDTGVFAGGTARQDGMLFMIGARSNANSPTTLGAAPAANMRVGTLKVILDGVTVRNYSKQALSGSNDTLFPDTVGGNDGTLINFPTDDSQWIFYDDGGGGTVTPEPELHEFSGSATVNALSFAQISKATQHNGQSLVTASATASSNKVINISGGATVVAQSVSLFEKRNTFSGDASINATSQSSASKRVTFDGQATVNVIASASIIDGNFEIHSFSGGALITASASGQAVKIGLVSGSSNATTSTSAKASKTAQLSGNATISTSTQSLFSKIASVTGNALTRVTTLTSAFKRVTLSGASRVFATVYGTFFNTESNVETYELTVQGRVKAPIVVQGTIKSLTIQGRVK